MAVTDPEYFNHTHWDETLWEGSSFGRMAVPSGWLYYDVDHRCTDRFHFTYVPDYWADHVVAYRERQKAKHGAKLKEDREDDLRLRPASTWTWRKPAKEAEAAKGSKAKAEAIAMDPEVLAELEKYR